MPAIPGNGMAGIYPLSHAAERRDTCSPALSNDAATRRFQHRDQSVRLYDFCLNRTSQRACDHGRDGTGRPRILSVPSQSMEPARPPQTSGFLHATDFEEGPEGSGQIFLSMSARALKFLDRWMAEHLPNVSTETQGPLPSCRRTPGYCRASGHRAQRDIRGVR